MANKRIKDLATTASSAASDDFMALDGATNGTRKMSAANPSVTTLTTSGVIAPGGSVHGANGAVGNPSFAFLSDQDTGLYRIGANNIGVAANGAKMLDISTTGLGVTGAVTATTTLADQGGTIAAQRNGLAPAQGLAFNGSAGSTVANVPAFGTGDFTVSAKVRLDSLTASATAAIFGGSGNGFALTVFNSAGSYLIYPRIVYGSAITSVAAISLGLTANVTYTRSSATTGKIYVNGILADTVTDANNYTGVVAAIGSNSAAAEWFWNGVITPVAIENRALSAAEVLALYQSGAVASGDYNSASNTALTPSGNWSNNSMASISGASTTGFTAAYGGGGEGYVQQDYTSRNFAKGQKFRVACNLTVNSGATPNFIIFNNGGFSFGMIADFVSLSAGANSFEVTLTAGQLGQMTPMFHSGSATNFTISGFSVTPLGALLAPDSAQVGGGLTWYDTSGNAANITLPATGVSWSLPTSGKAFSLSLSSTTAGSSGAGALVVSGGLATGAASYIGGALTTTGTITSLVGNNAALFLALSATTGYQYVAIQSTGAALRIGVEDSAGAALVAGSSPYDTFIGTANATGLTLSTNGTKRLRIDSAGAATFGGAVTAGGKITSAVSTATGYNQLYDTTGLTTGRGAFAITSTGAGLAFGVESSTPGTSFTGSAAYSSYFGTSNATPVYLVTNGVIRQTIDSTGAATFAGAVSSAAATFRPASDGVGLTLNQANSASAGWSFSPLNSGSLTVTRIGGVIAMTCDLNGNTAFNTSTTQTFGAVVISSGNSLKLGNAYVAGAVVGTGSITIQDSTGTTYRIPVLV